MQTKMLKQLDSQVYSDKISESLLDPDFVLNEIQKKEVQISSMKNSLNLDNVVPFEFKPAP